MGTSEPIKNRDELKKLINYYKKEKPSVRNDALICIGLYTGLRVSDILSLRWCDVMDDDLKKFKKHIELIESKTGKFKQIAISKPIKTALKAKLKTNKNVTPQTYIFVSNRGVNEPISRVHAYRIVKNAVRDCVENSSHISTHSLRKTFGYYAWKQGVQPALLMDLFNHSSYQITKRYLGIDQDEKDKIYLNIKF